MSVKMYTLEVSETELARIMFVMARVNGLTDGEPVYSQAHNIFGCENNSFEDCRALYEALGLSCIDYILVQEEWEKALGVGKFKKSPLQQRIENLEKELDELKKIL